jgi:hypothetical protein
MKFGGLEERLTRTPGPAQSTCTVPTIPLSQCETMTSAVQMHPSNFIVREADQLLARADLALGRGARQYIRTGRVGLLAFLWRSVGLCCLPHGCALFSIFNTLSSTFSFDLPVFLCRLQSYTDPTSFSPLRPSSVNLALTNHSDSAPATCKNACVAMSSRKM